MAGLYPSLHEKFRAENICPICMTDTETSARYICSNNHTLCYRCKQFYHACPTCLTPLVQEPSKPMCMPQPAFNMPQPSFESYPYPPPSAPVHDDFLGHEQRCSQELLRCPYASNGCWAKFPPSLQDVHVSRCQFRPNLEEECLPTDLRYSDCDLVDCRYNHLGCQVRIPPHRRFLHENRCNFHNGDHLEHHLGSLNLSEQPVYTNDDANTVVRCKFAEHGCKIRVPLRSLTNHESKCPHNRDGVAVYVSDDEDDTHCQRMLVECRYSRNGCILKIPADRLDFHEERCTYRNNEERCHSPEFGGSGMVKCRYSCNGCIVEVPAHKAQFHEERCMYRNGQDQCEGETVSCKYRHRGCKARLIPHMRHIHESRCPHE